MGTVEKEVEDQLSSCKLPDEDVLDVDHDALVSWREGDRLLGHQGGRREVMKEREGKGEV